MFTLPLRLIETERNKDMITIVEAMMGLIELDHSIYSNKLLSINICAELGQLADRTKHDKQECILFSV